MSPKLQNLVRILVGFWPCLLALAVVWPVLTTDYGLVEDFLHLIDPAYTDGPLHKTVYFREGRPLAGLWIHWVFGQTDTVADLTWIRAQGVVGLLIWLILLSCYGQRALQWDRGRSGAVALLLTLTPGVLLFAAWATAAVYLYGMILAFAGGWLMMHDSRRTWISWTAGLGVLLLALCIYQPIASVALLPAWLSLLNATPASKAHLRTIVGFGVAMVLYFLAFKGVTTLGWINSERLSRVSPLSAWQDTVSLLFREILPRALKGWGSLLETPVPWILGIVGLGGLLALRAKDSLRSLMFSWILLTVISAGILGPILFTGGYTPWRLLVVVGIAWQSLPALLLTRLPTRLSEWGLGAMIVVMGGYAAFVVQRGFVQPLGHEYHSLKCGVLAHKAAIQEAPTAPIFLRLPGDSTASISPVRGSHEYGSYTTQNIWAWREMTTQLIRESFELPRQSRGALSKGLHICPIPASANPSSGTVLDYAEWLGSPTSGGSEFAQYTHSPLGWMRTFGAGWYRIEGLGWIWAWGAPEPRWAVKSTTYGDMIILQELNQPPAIEWPGGRRQAWGAFLAEDQVRFRQQVGIPTPSH